MEIKKGKYSEFNYLIMSALTMEWERGNLYLNIYLPFQRFLKRDNDNSENCLL